MCTKTAIFLLTSISFTYVTLQWERYWVSNIRQPGCSFNSLFRPSPTTKTSKIRMTGICEGNHLSPMASHHKDQQCGKHFCVISTSLMENQTHSSRLPVYFYCQFPLTTNKQCMELNALQWRHNGHDGVSNLQRLVCLLSWLTRRRSKKTSQLGVTGLCEGNSPATGEFPLQKASNAEIISIWWRHHGATDYTHQTGLSPRNQMDVTPRTTT